MDSAKKGGEESSRKDSTILTVFTPVRKGMPIRGNNEGEALTKTWIPYGDVGVGPGKPDLLQVSLT